MKIYQAAALELAKLVEEKNVAYGNSFKDSAYFLKLLFPDGIPTDKYQDILLLVRVFDKLKRIATRKDAFGESPWKDITGYGLLGVVNDGNMNQQEYNEFNDELCEVHRILLYHTAGESFCPECSLEKQNAAFYSYLNPKP